MTRRIPSRERRMSRVPHGETRWKPPMHGVSMRTELSRGREEGRAGRLVTNPSITRAAYPPQFENGLPRIAYPSQFQYGSIKDTPPSEFKYGTIGTSELSEFENGTTRNAELCTKPAQPSQLQRYGNHMFNQYGEPQLSQTTMEKFLECMCKYRENQLLSLEKKLESIPKPNEWMPETPARRRKKRGKEAAKKVPNRFPQIRVEDESWSTSRPNQCQLTGSDLTTIQTLATNNGFDYDSVMLLINSRFRSPSPPPVRGAPFLTTAPPGSGDARTRANLGYVPSPPPSTSPPLTWKSIRYQREQGAGATRNPGAGARGIAKRGKSPASLGRGEAVAKLGFLSLIQETEKRPRRPVASKKSSKPEGPRSQVSGEALKNVSTNANTDHHLPHSRMAAARQLHRPQPKDQRGAPLYDCSEHFPQTISSTTVCVVHRSESTNPQTEIHAEDVTDETPEGKDLGGDNLTGSPPTEPDQDGGRETRASDLSDASSPEESDCDTASQGRDGSPSPPDLETALGVSTTSMFVPKTRGNASLMSPQVANKAHPHRRKSDQSKTSLRVDTVRQAESDHKQPVGPRTSHASSSDKTVSLARSSSETPKTAYRYQRDARMSKAKSVSSDTVKGTEKTKGALQGRGAKSQTPSSQISSDSRSKQRTTAGGERSQKRTQRLNDTTLRPPNSLTNAKTRARAPGSSASKHGGSDSASSTKPKSFPSITRSQASSTRKPSGANSDKKATGPQKPLKHDRKTNQPRSNLTSRAPARSDTGRGVPGTTLPPRVSPATLKQAPGRRGRGKPRGTPLSQLPPVANPHEGPDSDDSAEAFVQPTSQRGNTRCPQTAAKPKRKRAQAASLAHENKDPPKKNAARNKSRRANRSKKTSEKGKDESQRNQASLFWHVPSGDTDSESRDLGSGSGIPKKTTLCPQVSAKNVSSAKKQCAFHSKHDFLNEPKLKSCPPEDRRSQCSLEWKPIAFSSTSDIINSDSPAKTPATGYDPAKASVSYHKESESSIKSSPKASSSVDEVSQSSRRWKLSYIVPTPNASGQSSAAAAGTLASHLRSSAIRMKYSPSRKELPTKEVLPKNPPAERSPREETSIFSSTESSSAKAREKSPLCTRAFVRSPLNSSQLKLASSRRPDPARPQGTKLYLFARDAGKGPARSSLWGSRDSPDSDLSTSFSMTSSIQESSSRERAPGVRQAAGPLLAVKKDFDDDSSVEFWATRSKAAPRQVKSASAGGKPNKRAAAKSRHATAKTRSETRGAGDSKHMDARQGDARQGDAKHVVAKQGDTKHMDEKKGEAKQGETKRRKPRSAPKKQAAERGATSAQKKTMKTASWTGATSTSTSSKASAPPATAPKKKGSKSKRPKSASASRTEVKTKKSRVKTTKGRHPLEDIVQSVRDSRTSGLIAGLKSEDLNTYLEALQDEMPQRRRSNMLEFNLWRSRQRSLAALKDLHAILLRARRNEQRSTELLRKMGMPSISSSDSTVQDQRCQPPRDSKTTGRAVLEPAASFSLESSLESLVESSPSPPSMSESQPSRSCREDPDPCLPAHYNSLSSFSDSSTSEYFFDGLGDKALAQAEDGSPEQSVSASPSPEAECVEKVKADSPIKEEAPSLWRTDGRDGRADLDLSRGFLRSCRKIDKGHFVNPLTGIPDDVEGDNSASTTDFNEDFFSDSTAVEIPSHEALFSFSDTRVPGNAHQPHDSHAETDKGDNSKQARQKGASARVTSHGSASMSESDASGPQRKRCWGDLENAVRIASGETTGPPEGVRSNGNMAATESERREATPDGLAAGETVGQRLGRETLRTEHVSNAHFKKPLTKKQINDIYKYLSSFEVKRTRSSIG